LSATVTHDIGLGLAIDIVALVLNDERLVKAISNMTHAYRLDTKVFRFPTLQYKLEKKSRRTWEDSLAILMAAAVVLADGNLGGRDALAHAANSCVLLWNVVMKPQIDSSTLAGQTAALVLSMRTLLPAKRSVKTHTLLHYAYLSRTLPPRKWNCIQWEALHLMFAKGVAHNNKDVEACLLTGSAAKVLYMPLPEASRASSHQLPGGRMTAVYGANRADIASPGNCYTSMVPNQMWLHAYQRGAVQRFCCATILSIDPDHDQVYVRFSTPTYLAPKASPHWTHRLAAGEPGVFTSCVVAITPWTEDGVDTDSVAIESLLRPLVTLKYCDQVYCVISHPDDIECLDLRRAECKPPLADLQRACATWPTLATTVSPVGAGSV
jgi:hypothetical protein